LHEAIFEVLLEYPDTGYKRIKRFLKWKGIRVTEQRVRQAKRLVDPEGVDDRRSQNRATVRRVYHVNYSNRIWHIDANIKLIR